MYNHAHCSVVEQTLRISKRHDYYYYYDDDYDYYYYFYNKNNAWYGEKSCKNDRDREREYTHHRP